MHTRNEQLCNIVATVVIHIQLQQMQCKSKCEYELALYKPNKMTQLTPTKLYQTIAIVIHEIRQDTLTIPNTYSSIESFVIPWELDGPTGLSPASSGWSSAGLPKDGEFVGP